MGKVRYGNYNAGYAPIEDGGTFGTPVMLPGLVSANAEVEETNTKVPADNKIFCVIPGKKVRSLTLGFRSIQEDYAVMALGYKANTNGMMTDTGQKKPHCIFWFDTEFDCETGQEVPVIHYFYNVMASETSSETETIGEEEIEVQVLEINYESSDSNIAVDKDDKPCKYGKIARTTENAKLFDTWKSKVILPKDSVDAAESFGLRSKK